LAPYLKAINFNFFVLIAKMAKKAEEKIKPQRD
jgi:hypothetical protein